MIPKLGIELRNQSRRRRVVDMPKRGEGAACAGLDGHASQTEGGPLISFGCFARAERQELDRLAAVLFGPNESLKIVQVELSISDLDVTVPRTAIESTVGCEMSSELCRPTHARAGASSPAWR